MRKGAWIRPALVAGSILLAGASLTACSSKAGSDAAGSDQLASKAGRPEDKFGKGFGKAFRAPPNSEPAKLSDVDMVPVSLTDEPVQIN